MKLKDYNNYGSLVKCLFAVAEWVLNSYSCWGKLRWKGGRGPSMLSAHCSSKHLVCLLQVRNPREQFIGVSGINTDSSWNDRRRPDQRWASALYLILDSPTHWAKTQPRYICECLLFIRRCQLQWKVQLKYPLYCDCKWVDEWSPGKNYWSVSKQ